MFIVHIYVLSLFLFVCLDVYSLETRCHVVAELEPPEPSVAGEGADAVLALPGDVVAGGVGPGGAPEVALVIPVPGAGVVGLALPGEREHALLARCWARGCLARTLQVCGSSGCGCGAGGS